ncbi:MAG: germination protein YpeB [Clostridia bacterium]|nr:germination protein YpeB [Clostridia bacterium]
MNKKETSSGVQKAEALADNGNSSKKSVKKSAPAKQVKHTTAKTEKKQPVKQVKKNVKDKKKKPVKSERAIKRQQRKELRIQKKLEAAKIRAEKKQKRLEKKLEAKQKRLDRIAAIKQARAERRERRKERRDVLKHESKEARRERIAEERKAKREARVAKKQAIMEERKAKREHRLKVRAEKRAERNDKRHAPGFGGWLAAVITLGVTTLALGTMTTYGWINMNGMQAEIASTHTESVYELNSIVDNLDANLSKARVANSQSEQVRLLSEIAIESEMAETVLERLPVETQFTQNVTSFVNKMGDSAQGMLRQISGGKKLSESQIASLEYMYKTNAQLKKTINELVSEAGTGDVLAAMRGKTDGLFYVSFGELENNPVEVPKEINDGPFAENVKKASSKNLQGLKEISASEAENLAKKYFNDYNVTEANCMGEATAEQLTVYNLLLKTNDGEMYAQISKQGGKVVEFNSYKDCSDKNFSVERCIDIAEDFLKSLGYSGMKPVWTSENGTTCNLNFVYENNGVIYYSDMVKVKVCEERGIVTGAEALSYVLNHTERNIGGGNATIGKSEAKAKLHEGFEVKGARLAVIPVEGDEVLCYEFNGEYEGSEYYIYIDAATGNEVEVLTVIGTAQGRALM